MRFPRIKKIWSIISMCEKEIKWCPLSFPGTLLSRQRGDTRYLAESWGAETGAQSGPRTPARFSESLYPHWLTWGQNWEAGDTTQMCRSHEVGVRMDHSGRIENNGGSPVGLPRASQSPASGSYLGRTPLYCPKPSHHWPKDWSSGIKAAWQPSKAHTRP